MSVFDEAKIDCHCHLFDPARFPYGEDTPYRPAGQEVATLEQMEAMFAAYGVRGALLVQPNSGYGTDISCMLDAIITSAGRFKGMAVVPLDIGLDELAGLKARGIVGVAFNPAGIDLDYWLGAGALLEKLQALDMVLQVQARDDQWLALLPLLRDFTGRLLIDHCGRPSLRAGLGAPGFQAVLELGRTGQAWIKLSGYAKFTRVAWPHRDVWPYVAALKEAFGVERCLWGSDWPFIRAEQRVDYGPLLVLAERLFPDAAERKRFLSGNAAELCGIAT